jgi:F-type H+-transporting ATPase subunit b
MPSTKPAAPRATRLAAAIAAAIALVFVLGAVRGAAEAAPAGDSPHVNWFDFDYGSKNWEGEPLAPGETAMSPPFPFALVNFGLLLLLLGLTAAPAIARYLDKRHITIKQALEESARLRDEAKQKLEDYTRRIADVETEVEQLITRIRADAEAEKGLILERAQAQAALLQKDAEKRIAAEISRARRELEREVVIAAVSAATRLLRERGTPAEQQALADAFITELDTSAGPTRPGGEVNR